MRILITTFRVRGDVQPYLALAVGLQGAGHRVTLATSQSFSQWIAAYGVKTHPVRFNIKRRPTDTLLGGQVQRRLYQLTAEKLAEAMQTAVVDSALRARAAALGEKIRAEEGVARAVEIIARHVGSSKLSRRRASRSSSRSCRSRLKP
jgi:UDP:flavonoid glycosyltransferase YjiC (YdhE family)